MNSIRITSLALLAWICVCIDAAGQSVRSNCGFGQYGECVVPPDLGEVLSLAAGDRFVVAVRTDGTVRSWGVNWYDATSVPIGLTSVSSVAAHPYGSHAVALRTDGTVHCWGRNDYGQCDAPARTAGIISVSAGVFHSAAIGPASSLHIWGVSPSQSGDPNYGQCAIPADLGPVRQVACGGWHTLVVLSGSNLVRGWGFNFHGESSPPPDLGPVSSIAAGAFHSVALLQDGTVRCWGNNQYGQCPGLSGLNGPGKLVAGAWQTAVVSSQFPYITSEPAGGLSFGGLVIPKDLVIGGSTSSLALVQSACPADVSPSDGTVDGVDLGALLAEWGPDLPTTRCDFNGDGAVDGIDLGYLLSRWGPCTN